ncbi:Competence protein A [Streptomyces sp. MA5143a]|nr:Competence protein A [Streptomyces sp. MA5143a]
MSMTAFEADANQDEESSHRHAEYFLSIFHQAGLCMASLDSDARLLEMNSDFSRWFGGPPSALRGRPFLDLLHPASRTGVQGELARVTTGCRVRTSAQGVALRSDGSPLSVELTMIGVRDPHTFGVETIVLVSPEQVPVGGVAAEHGDPAEQPAAPIMLTETEARILEQLATGFSTQQLARRMHLSSKGVEYHISALLRKVGVPNRTALVSWAHSLGILSPGWWPPRVATTFVRPSA